MQEHFSDPGIYIRSMATRGSLGGLARTTADVATVLDASGRDIILIETVGVGQDEVDIVRLADITVVILVPGMGDDVQTIKAGIMEIADIFVINKSDREGAERVEREIRALQSLAMRARRMDSADREDGRQRRQGMEELAEAIAAYEGYLKKENLVLKKNVENWQERLVEMLRDAMLEKARAQLGDGNVKVAQPKSPSTSAIRIRWWRRLSRRRYVGVKDLGFDCRFRGEGHRKAIGKSSTELRSAWNSASIISASR